MRHSALKHPVAVLRKIINYKQPAFAKLVKCSPSTIAQIETLAAPLSLGLAARITIETGVDATWLLRGDPKAPPLKMHSQERYSLQSFEKYRSEQASLDLGGSMVFQLILLNAVGGIAGMMLRAIRTGHRQLFAYRLLGALRDWNEEFGGANDLFGDDKAAQRLIDTFGKADEKAVIDLMPLLQEFNKAIKPQPPSAKQQSSRPPAVRSKTKQPRGRK